MIIINEENKYLLEKVPEQVLSLADNTQINTEKSKCPEKFSIHLCGYYTTTFSYSDDITSRIVKMVNSATLESFYNFIDDNLVVSDGKLYNYDVTKMLLERNRRKNN